MAYESKRWYCDTGAYGLMCNNCKHYRKNATCDAYPNGIPKGLLDKGEHNTPYPGDNGIRYEPAEN